MKKNETTSKLLLLLIMLSSTFNFNTKNAFSQSEFDEEEYIEEEEEGIEEAPIEDEEISDEEFEEGYDSEELYENEEGLDDPNGMYKLDDITANTFQQISNIERENALMKLRIEQGKLKLDLEKQKAEKKKIEASVAEDARQRKIKQQEQERKLAEEIKKQKLQDEKDAEERRKKSQEDEINKKLLEKINSADLSNPDDVKALTQLMSLSTGKSVGGALGTGATKEVVPFDEKYSVKSIIGAGKNLIANIENIAKKSTFKVRVGSAIDEWIVEDIRGTSVLLKKGNDVKIMNLN